MWQRIGSAANPGGRADGHRTVVRCPSLTLSAAGNRCLAPIKAALVVARSAGSPIAFGTARLHGWQWQATLVTDFNSTEVRDEDEAVLGLPARLLGAAGIGAWHL